MVRASNQMNDFLESGQASRGGEGRESPQSSRKCLAKAISASSVSGGVVRQSHTRLKVPRSHKPMKRSFEELKWVF